METNHEHRPPIILLVGEHSRLQKGLIALLSSLPQMPAIVHVQTGSSALRLLGMRKPNLVVLDANLPDINVVTILRYIKNSQGGLHCIVLADTMEQQAAARAAGAEAALLKGFPAAELFAAIGRLLPPGGDEEDDGISTTTGPASNQRQSK